ncbi:phospholipase-like protein [Tanacetum coccineum]
MTDMTQKAPLGIVENVLVKINKFLIPFDFMIMDMLGEPNETMILGRPFLATIHAQIDVFKSKISLGIGGDRILFDMDGNVCHSNIPVEKVYMTNSIQDDEPFNPLRIGDDLFSYESPPCLQFEQYTRFCDDESIDTVESSDNMQEPKVEHKKVVNLEKVRYGNKDIDDTTVKGETTSGWHKIASLRIMAFRMKQRCMITLASITMSTHTHTSLRKIKDSTCLGLRMMSRLSLKNDMPLRDK